MKNRYCEDQEFNSLLEKITEFPTVEETNRLATNLTFDKINLHYTDNPFNNKL